ncbi:MAG: GspH/FimT family pseudopilin [Desulfobacteraceae bacterium]|nr:GspH/FimT family pseudopilin [Deltaproteobacteria bacterium]MBL6978296.1 GspH/FimT family pseudopilin [Desulfobacteraceae bacterium]MBL7217223.1 GspH/FimT family pseudopilin [Desulfobacteraceae bacterium]
MKKGFTLLELLIVLVIISIAAAFVGPRVAGSMSTLTLKTAAKKVAASLRYARSQATSESRPYFVLFDPDKGRLTIKSGQTAPQENEEKEAVDGEQDTGTSEEMADNNQVKEKLKVYALPEGVRFDKVASDKNEASSDVFQIVFFPNGGSSGGEVLLENDRGRRYNISVDFVVGTVRLKEEGAKSSRRKSYAI